MTDDSTDAQWTAALLPWPAVTALVSAAKRARTFKDDSLQRKLCIEDAIKKVKAEYPEFFRTAPWDRPVWMPRR